MVVGCLLCAYFSVNYPAVLESFSTLCTEKLIHMTAETKMTYLDIQESRGIIFISSVEQTLCYSKMCNNYYTISMSF